MRRWFIFIGIAAAIPVVFTSSQSAGLPSGRPGSDRGGVLFELPGESGGDHLGLMIAAAGDVNGDGTEDFAAGLPFHDGHSGADCGQVLFYSGADGSIIHDIEGQQAGERFGRELCLGDDIDNDGVPDLLVGAPSHDVNNVLDCGRIYLVSGSSGTLIDTLDGKEPSEQFGLSIARAGDVTQDGITEILVGAPTYEGPLGVNTGRVFLYTMTGNKIGTAIGETAGDLFGYTLCAVENHGGAPPEFWLFGAPAHDTGTNRDSGRVYVYSLATRSFITAFDGENTKDLFGSALDASGDFDGDGRNDVIVGCRGYDGAAGAGSGKAVVLSGASGAKLHEFEGEAENNKFGSTVAAVADLDNDGCDEILVAAPFFSNKPIGSQAGRVYLFDGKTGSLRFSIDPGVGIEYGGDYFGTGLAGISDLTGDGKADILGGAPSHDSTLGRSDIGQIHLFSGFDGSKVHTINGHKGGDHFGYAVEGGVSDVDGDGFPDFIVGAVGHCQPGEEAVMGRVYAISAMDGSTIMTADGDQSDAMFGIVLAGMGDVNDDALGDFLVGAPKYDELSKPKAGRAYIYLGGQSTPSVILSGANPNDLFGTSLARVADYNGDGKADFLVGAPGYGNSRGRVSLFSGTDGTLIDSFDGERPGDRFGQAVSSAGDVDNDGVVDFLVGAPGYDAAGMADSGRISLFSGANFSLLGSPEGQNAGDGFGSALARLGDINGDGHSEFIVGAENHSGPSGVFCGSASVFSGANMQVVYYFEGGNNRSHLGHDVAGIGDGDGDLVNDFCISAHRHADFGTGFGDKGRVCVFSGADGSLLDQFDGEGPDWMGTSISGAGDVNFDGRCDIIAGAPLCNDVDPGLNAGNQGKVFVFSIGP